MAVVCIAVFVCAGSAFAQEKPNSKSRVPVREKAAADQAPKAFPQFEESFSEGDAANRRAEWFYGQRAKPFSKILPGVHAYALEQMQKRIERDRMRPMALTPGATMSLNPAISTTSWTAIGPQPTDTSQTFRYTSTSGRIESIAIDPRNVNTVYIASALGGVWKTTDGGLHWTPLTDQQKSLAGGAIAIDPNAPDTVYVGTGEGGALFGYDGYYGAGILKSTNGGSSWTQIGSTFFGPTSSSFLCGGGFISSLAIQPNNSQVMLATGFICSSGSYSYGVFRSTDGGNSWTLVRNGLAYEVKFDPSNPSVAYTGIGNQFGFTTTSGYGIFKSTDGGATWSALNGTAPNTFPTTNVGRISFTIAASQPATMYAAVGRADNTQALGIWKTTDGGKNWTQASATGLGDWCTDLDSQGNVVSPQCWFDNVIAVHPKSPNVVYVGGAENPRGVPLFVSTDGAGTFTRATPATSGEGLHADTHAIVFSNDGTVLYTGDDGGMWSTTNTTSSAPIWTNLNSTLNLTQFYPGIAIDPTDITQTLGGAQDNGTQVFFSGGWQFFACGDGGFNAWDSTGNNIYLSCTGSLFLAGVNLVTGSANVFDTTAISADTSRMNFVPPMVIDPSKDTNLYFGTYRVWQSQDSGVTWSAISPDLTKTTDGSVISIAVSPVDSKTVWALTNDGKIQLSTNATSGTAATWADKTPTSGWPGRTPTSVVADPASATTAYVTFSGFTFNTSGQQVTVTRGHLFKTTNGGTNWSDITGDLENINTPVNKVVIDPVLPNTIYAATDVGVFVSQNGGVNWSVLGTGLPHTAVLDLVLHKGTRTMRAATHGRGMWDLSVPSTTQTSGSLSASPSFLTFLNVGVNTTSAGQTVTLTASGSAVTISSVSASTGFPISANGCNGATLQVGGKCTFVVSFAPTAAGTVTGSVTVASNGSGSPQTIQLEGNGTVASGSGVTPENGWWWDSKLSGSGFFLEFRPASAQNPTPGIFIGGFMYDAVGNATWLVTVGNAAVPGSSFTSNSSGLTYTGQWLACSNGQTLTGTWKQNNCSSAGPVTVVFSSSQAASMTRPDGSVIALTRFAFNTNPISPPMPGTAQNGWWWIDPVNPTYNPGGGGTGYGIEIQGNLSFIVAYVYDGTGKATWDLALTSTPITNPANYSATWSNYSGTPHWCLLGSAVPTCTPEGSYNTTHTDLFGVTFNFTDTTHGTMTMNGVTIPITKFTAF